MENALISAKELARKAECAAKDIPNIIEAINSCYTNNGHALVIVDENKNYLLAINKALSSDMSSIYKAKNQQKLSKALLETLAVVAYSQPITKTDIDKLRGVNSEGAIKLLISQTLIKVIGKKPVAGTPNEYGTTAEFLKTFGLKSIKDLPKMKEGDRIKFFSPKKEVPNEEETTEYNQETIKEYEKQVEQRKQNSLGIKRKNK